jgi:transposase
VKYSIHQFHKDFPDDDACLDKLFVLRYRDKPECPKCHRDSNFHRVKGRKAYACQWCAHQIYPCAGTPLEKTTTPLTSWFYAMYLMTASRNGVSAKELERQLGVSYKCAWRMGHKIRELMDKLGMTKPLSGHVEIDETYVGGKRHGSKRGRGAEGKAIVFGTLERGGEVQGRIVSDVKRRTLEPIIRTSVKEGATVSTDELKSYKDLVRFGYEHGQVAHGAGEYVSGMHHVNSLEGFFSQLKRGIVGTHIHVSRKHLPKYVGEFAFRYNNRKDPGAMFERVIRNF